MDSVIDKTVLYSIKFSKKTGMYVPGEYSFNKINHRVNNFGFIGEEVSINNKTGWNVDPLNTNKLNKVMFEALNNHEKRIEFGKNAQKTFLDKFSGERVFKKFLENVKILY